MDCLKFLQVTKDERHLFFLRIAYIMAIKESNDESSKNCALIVKDKKIISTGLSGYADYLLDIPGIKEKPKKYDYCRHAERDAIFNAAKLVESTDGATMYVPWYSCGPCGQAIADSGIARVVGHIDTFIRTPERWESSVSLGIEIMHKKGVELLVYKGNIGGVEAILNGRRWNP